MKHLWLVEPIYKIGAQNQKNLDQVNYLSIF